VTLLSPPPQTPSLTSPPPSEVLSQVWSVVVRMIDQQEPVNEVAVRDLLEESCDNAPGAVLQQYSIRQVEAPAGFMSGAVWFVVRDRPAGATITQAETSAAHKACQVGVGGHSCTGQRGVGFAG